MPFNNNKRKSGMNKIDEPHPLNDVSEFHKTFEMPVNQTPSIPAADRCRLRINLIEEELNELKEAIEDNDLIEVADAFCDLQYVLSGAILEFGLGVKFKSLFEEVQRSNMSKTCKSRAEAEATQQHYLDKDGTVSEIVHRGDEFIVYRKEDKKVLKSINYSKANLEQFL